MFFYASQRVNDCLARIAHFLIAIIGRFLTEHRPHKGKCKGRVNAMPFAAMMSAQRRAVSLDATQISYQLAGGLRETCYFSDSSLRRVDLKIPHPIEASTSNKMA